jgi:hypothetical protein
VQLKIVPIGEVDPEVAAVESIARGLDALTPEQRKASKWPSPDQLRKAVRATGERLGLEVWDGGGRSTFDMSLSRYKDRAKTELATTLTVYLYARNAYYCSGDAEILGALAAEVATVAGPQVTFAAEDGCWEPVTRLHVAPGKAPSTKTITRDEETD